MLASPQAAQGGGPRQRVRVRTTAHRLRGRAGRAAGAGQGPRGGGPLAAPAAPGRAQARAHARGAAARDQGPAGPGRLPEREAHLHPARGARAHRRAARGGRQAHPAAVGLRHVPRPATTTAPSTCSPAAARCGSRCTPSSRPTSSSAGARSCSTSRSTSCWPAGGELTGEVVTLKEVLEDGTRALIVGRADEERVVELAEALHGREAALRRHAAHGPPLRAAAREAAPARGRGAGPRRGARHRLRRRRRPRRPDRADRRRRRAAVPAPGPVRRAQAAGAEGHPALRPARLRQDAHRQGGGQLAGQEGGRGRGDKAARSYFLNIKGPELLNKYVGETERQIRLVFQRAREKSEEGWPVIVFFDEMDSMFRTRGTRHQLRHGVDDRAAAARRDRRRRDAEERHRHRRVQPRGPHRPGHPAARAAST